MNRRDFLTGLGAALAAPLGTEAQQGGQSPRIGFLSAVSLSDPSLKPYFGAFRQALRDVGLVEGENFTIEWRSADRNYQRLPDLAAELVRLKMDLIVASGGPPVVRAAQRATATIPIGHLREADVLAKALGVQLYPVMAQSHSAIDETFAAMTREHVDGLYVVADSMLIDERHRIADLALKRRLPAVYANRLHVEAGGLMAYGADVLDQLRGVARYIARILKGAKPADLPVEQPTKFEFVINLKTAKASGLTMPASVLTRADQVIE